MIGDTWPGRPWPRWRCGRRSGWRCASRGCSGAAFLDGILSPELETVRPGDDDDVVEMLDVRGTASNARHTASFVDVVTWPVLRLHSRVAGCQAVGVYTSFRGGQRGGLAAGRSSGPARPRVVWVAVGVRGGGVRVFSRRGGGHPGRRRAVGGRSGGGAAGGVGSGGVACGARVGGRRRRASRCGGGRGALGVVRWGVRV